MHDEIHPEFPYPDNGLNRESSRDATTGRFKKGAKPGPGRPRKKDGDEPPLLLRSETDAELVLRAAEIRDSFETWRVLLDGHNLTTLAELIEDLDRRRRFVPSWVRVALAKKLAGE